jgi:hypothetical protein
MNPFVQGDAGNGEIRTQRWTTQISSQTQQSIEMQFDEHNDGKV